MFNGSVGDLGLVQDKGTQERQLAEVNEAFVGDGGSVEGEVPELAEVF